MTFDPSLTHAILYALLAGTALAGAWVAFAGMRHDGAFVATATAVAALLRGTIPSVPGQRMAGDRSPGETLRAPFGQDSLDPTSGTPGLTQAVMVLLWALDEPRAPYPNVVEAMDAARRGRRVVPLGPPHIHFREGSLGRLQFDHAWMETLLVELMMRCREAGAWVAPAHLDPFLDGRADIACALRAGLDGTVGREGAGIVAHWKAEKAARQPLRIPRVAAAEAALGEAGR